MILMESGNLDYTQATYVVHLFGLYDARQCNECMQKPRVYAEL